MKNVSLALNALLVVAVMYLYYAHFTGSKKTSSSSTNTTKTASTSDAAKPIALAYVDIDSLENNYEYFKNKKSELEKKQTAIDGELSGKARAIENEIAKAQQAAQTMSQNELESTQARIGKMQQDLELKRQTLGQQFMASQAAFNDDLQKRLDSYLEKYNEDKGYAFIFSYTKGTTILYKDNQYNITSDVIDGMNKEYASSAKK